MHAVALLVQDVEQPGRFEPGVRRAAERLRHQSLVADPPRLERRGPLGLVPLLRIHVEPPSLAMRPQGRARRSRAHPVPPSRRTTAVAALMVPPLSARPPGSRGAGWVPLVLPVIARPRCGAGHRPSGPAPRPIGAGAGSTYGAPPRRTISRQGQSGMDTGVRRGVARAGGAGACRGRETRTPASVGKPASGGWSSGRPDSNRGPPAPEAGALTGLRYAPNCLQPMRTGCPARRGWVLPVRLKCAQRESNP